jgi:ankyrin repeat protein
MLLDAGSAALNTPDHFGVRPLHKTVAFHRVAVLQELLRERGLHIDARVGIPTADASFGAESNRDTAIHLAARSGDAESGQMLRMLLRAGAALGVPDASGETGLHAAVRASNPSAVRQLVAAGADAHAPNHDGATPTELALTARANGREQRRRQEEQDAEQGQGGMQWLLGRVNPYSKEPLRVRETEQVCRALGIADDRDSGM